MALNIVLKGYTSYLIIFWSINGAIISCFGALVCESPMEGAILSLLPCAGSPMHSLLTKEWWLWAQRDQRASSLHQSTTCGNFHFVSKSHKNWKIWTWTDQKHANLNYIKWFWFVLESVTSRKHTSYEVWCMDRKSLNTACFNKVQTNVLVLRFYRGCHFWTWFRQLLIWFHMILYDV